MKTREKIRIVLICLMVIFLTACNKDNADWRDSVPDGEYFLRGNTVRFYYVDGKGKGLINPDDSTSFPISCEIIQANPPTPGNPINSGLYLDRYHSYYNQNRDKVEYDPEEGLYFFSTIVPGDQKSSNYVFYIYFSGAYDTMNLTYRYTNKDIIGCGGGWYAKIHSWKFNGKHIYSDDDKSSRKIFVQKSNGKTIVDLK